MKFIPLNWEIAKVILVYKVNDESDPSSDRRISLASILNRIHEKNDVISPKIVPWKYKILNDTQCGFREKRSTKLGILDIINQIQVNVGKKALHVWHIYSDLQKAFDTVNNSIWDTWN